MEPHTWKRRVSAASMYVAASAASRHLYVFSFLSLLFIVHPSFLCLFFLVVGAKEGSFARMGPAWPGTLAPERQVQGVWGAGSPPGNVEYDKFYVF